MGIAGSILVAGIAIAVGIWGSVGSRGRVYEYPNSFRRRIRLCFFGYVVLSLVTAGIVAVRNDTISGAIYTLGAATPILIAMLLYWWPMSARVVVTDGHAEGTSFFGRRTRVDVRGDLLVQRFAARTISGKTTWLRLRDGERRSILVTGELSGFDDFWRDLTSGARRLESRPPGMLDRIIRGSVVEDADIDKHGSGT